MIHWKLLSSRSERRFITHMLWWPNIDHDQVDVCGILIVVGRLCILDLRNSQHLQHQYSNRHGEAGDAHTCDLWSRFRILEIKLEAGLAVGQLGRVAMAEGSCPYRRDILTR